MVGQHQMQPSWMGAKCKDRIANSKQNVPTTRITEIPCPPSPRVNTRLAFHSLHPTHNRYLTITQIISMP
ncbi:hypothetical protein BJ508DRAFT_143296 [Ascobolus immersus RN42]|uniref:Uncharacterized protein n=1 Tax=Ascobolus immersus RN42 TaxID=1160509 RepID=A0A3N4I1I1_ASCIM|nr:hypothetical protein BJ508DRAFT_143296 [Ascobolus immersus RN42]